MKDENKTKAQLIAELAELRSRLEDGPTQASETAMTRDIGERRLMEDMLWENEQRFRVITENMRDTVWLMDLNFRTTWTTPSVLHLRGFTVEELAALPLDKQFTPESFAAASALIAQHLTPETLDNSEAELSVTAEFEFTRKDGGTVWADSTITLLRDGQGLPAGFLGVGRDISDRKQAEAALRKSEERFRIAAELASDLIYEWDPAMNQNQWFGDVDRTFGYDPGQFPRNVREQNRLIHPDDRSRVFQAMTRAMREGGLFNEEYRVRRKDGSYSFIVSRAVAVRGEGGQVERWIGINADITERKRSEAAIRESEEKLRKSEENYRLLIENQTDMIARVDAEGRLLFVSPSICETFGRTEAEVLGRSFLELMPDFSPAVARAALNSLHHPPYVYYLEYNFDTAFGPRWLAWGIKSVVDEDGKVQSMVCVGRDVTARRQFEETIQRLNRLLEATVSTIPSSILLLDHGLKVLMANRRYLEIRGAQAMDVEGRNIGDILPASLLESDGLLEKIRAVARRGGDESLRNVRHLSSDHPDKYLDLFIRGVRTHDGKNLVLVVMNDVTESVTLREQLLQSQKMEAIGELAGGIAHDFNNNLTPILVYANILLEGIGPGHPMYEDLVEIRSAAERSASLTNQLLAFGRKQVFEPETFSMNDVVTGMRKMIGRLIGENIELTTLLDDGLGLVRSDPRQIEHVIVNLAINARDAMPRGGRLTVRTGNFEADEDFARVYLESGPGPYVALSMSDTGMGVPEEIRARIFEPFFTTKEKGKGTGLGLSMVYGIVRQSGGGVRVQSEPGRGTAFEIYLPRVSGADFELREGPPRAERIEPGWTVLVVEDDEPVRRATERMIASLGCRVVSAGSGEQALDVWAECPEKIDLMITDVVMPGMTGLELAERLYELDPAVKVIFVSGYADDVFSSTDEIRPGARFISKPFSIEALAARIKELLGS